MFQNIVQFIKLILLIVYSFLFNFLKFIKYIYYGSHEIERILQSQSSDIYEKTMLVDDWLSRTKCKPIKKFFTTQLDTSAQNSAGKFAQAISRLLDGYLKDQQVECESQETSKGGRNPNKSISLTEKIVNLEEGDIIFASTLNSLTNDLLNVIVKAKNLSHFPSQDKECLRNILYRVLSFKMSLLVGEYLASTKYDASIGSHTRKLVSLWNNLLRSDKCKSSKYDSSSATAFPPEHSKEIDDTSLVSDRWSHIGFQGEDPGTDFRGMGLLGLIQLEYLSRKPNKLASDLLKRSLNEQCGYPFAIVGINITFNLLSLYKDGSLKHLYYDTGDRLFRDDQRTLSLLETLNNLYVEMFLRFDCFWHESKPETIFEFKPLMEKFINVIKIDLDNRNFTMKFIY